MHGCTLATPFSPEANGGSRNRSPTFPLTAEANCFRMLKYDSHRTCMAASLMGLSRPASFLKVGEIT
eukprot:10733972-Alexandrium_andersonii.AAC.1